LAESRAVTYWITWTPFFVVVMSTTAPVSEYAATLMFENSACTVKNDKQLVLVNGVIHLTTLWSIKNRILHNRW